MAKTWLGRPGQASLTSLQCPSNYPSEPCGIRPGWKTPREKRESHKYRQKPDFFKAKRTQVGRAGAPRSSSRKCCEKAPEGPVVGLCGSWTLTKHERHVLLANMREQPRKYPHVLALKATSTATSSPRVARSSLNGDIRRRNTARIRRSGLSFWPSSCPMRTAERIKDTLRRSMSSFCAPISFVRKALKGCVMHRWIRNGLKGCLEKKYPLVGFAHPLTAEHLKSRRKRFQTWDQMRGWLCSSCWQCLLKIWKF